MEKKNELLITTLRVWLGCSHPLVFMQGSFNACHNKQDMMSPAASFESQTLHASFETDPCPTTRWRKCDGDMCRQLCPNKVLILSIIQPWNKC